MLKILIRERGVDMSSDVEYASIFSVSFTPYEIRISLGRTHQVIGDNGPTNEIFIEWFKLLYVNPLATKQLQRILTVAVQQYETLYGVIPVEGEVTTESFPKSYNISQRH